MGGSEFAPQVATASGVGRKPASIVVINGSSSAGKTTLARALANELGPPWQSRHVDLVWPNFLTSGLRAIDIMRTVRATAPLVPRVFYEWNAVVTFFAMARVAADHGTPMILDSILLDDRIARYLCEVFDPTSTLLVAADCPLSVLKDRQAQRPSRRGRVERHYRRVHTSLVYDTVVDTSSSPATVLAAQLAGWVTATPAPVGLSATAAKLRSGTAP